jgi:hypothetical protein
LTLALQYKGFNYSSYYNGAYEDADSLAALSQTGANAVALNLQYGIDSVNSIRIGKDAECPTCGTPLDRGAVGTRGHCQVEAL